jgi:hypothetical protein
MKHDDQEYPESYDVPNEAPSEEAPADNYPPDEPYPVEYYPEPEEASPEPPSFGDHSPELVPPEPYPEECTPEAPAEEPPSPPEENAVRTSTAASLMTNISLYNDWETLSKKEQLKRRKALRKMGLPVPAYRSQLEV